MSEEIKVYVVKYPDRKSLYMRYLNPATGKQVARSTGETHQRDAERKAAKWEAELREGRYAKSSKNDLGGLSRILLGQCFARPG